MARPDHASAEGAVITIGIIRQRLAKGTGVVEEAGLSDNGRRQIAMGHIKPIVDDGNAHPPPQRKTPRPLCRNVGASDPAIAPWVVELAMLALGWVGGNEALTDEFDKLGFSRNRNFAFLQGVGNGQWIVTRGHFNLELVRGEG